MNAQRLSEEDLRKLEGVIADGEIVHNLPIIMRLIATIRFQQAELDRRVICAGMRLVPLEGVVS